MRLSGSAQFEKVYAAKTRASAGPLLVYGIPNDLNHMRLGLAAPRRIGTAVIRNTIKRKLREAFRLQPHEWSELGRGYDVVINVRPHEPLSTKEYQRDLLSAVKKLHATWMKRSQTQPTPDRPER